MTTIVTAVALLQSVPSDLPGVADLKADLWSSDDWSRYLSPRDEARVSHALDAAVTGQVGLFL